MPQTSCQLPVLYARGVLRVQTTGLSDMGMLQRFVGGMLWSSKAPSSAVGLFSNGTPVHEVLQLANS